MIKEVITDKDTLRGISQESEINEKSLAIGQDLIDTLVSTWKTTLKGFAIAAPQIGAFERIIAIGSGEIEENIELLFNPRVMYQSGKQILWEQCLSGAKELSKVERPYIIEVEYYNKNKEKITVTKSGISAIVVCHEIDHLDGIICQDIATKIINHDTLEEALDTKKRLRTEDPLVVLEVGEERTEIAQTHNEINIEQEEK